MSRMHTTRGYRYFATWLEATLGKLPVGLALCLALLAGAPVHGDVRNTRHNLTAAGPGPPKAAGVAEACVFCHVPHSASPVPGLWNRDLPAIRYNLYASSTLEASLNQPTGASRLCLSCHDGTTALGNLRVSPAAGRINRGPLTGRGSLGTDLSDDHPISFVYDAELALRQGKLADPGSLPAPIRLDTSRQLQCTSCHDPHEDRYRKFLRVDDRAGGLCLVCHRQRNWPGSAHATSTATWKGRGRNPWLESPYDSVAGNGCQNCHKPHAAPRPPRLLNHAEERAVCLVCHDGSLATLNVEDELLKPSAHPIASTNWTHDPREDPNTMPRHVTCADCHNPHESTANPASPPTASGPLKGVVGVNLSGGALLTATDEYEICLKCHGIRDQTGPGIVRDDTSRNVRLKISPSNPSYHPIAAAGKNKSMGGLEPGYSTASIIYCSDCHNNDDAAAAGGTAPRGPHGSRFWPILEREYQVDDPPTESLQVYALCYKCHNRDYLINDRASTFPHERHIRDRRVPCAACHDAHGSRQNLGLVNFMLRDTIGKTVVSPSQSQQRLEFISPKPGGGPGTGQCYLQCHGKNHEPESYP